MSAAAVRPLPTPEHPQRARVATQWAHAVFTDPEDARIFANHPGELPRMVAAYLEWAATP